MEVTVSIFDVIKDDHRKVEQLFEDIREASDPDDRFSLFESLREELTIHTRAEEEVLYKRLRSRMQDQMKEAYQEHEDALALCAKLQDLEPNDRDFLRTLDLLEQAIQHHVKEEEDEILPQAKSIVGADADNRLAAEFHREKGRIQGRDFEVV